MSPLGKTLHRSNSFTRIPTKAQKPALSPPRRQRSDSLTSPKPSSKSRSASPSTSDKFTQATPPSGTAFKAGGHRYKKGEEIAKGGQGKIEQLQPLSTIAPPRVVKTSTSLARDSNQKIEDEGKNLRAVQGHKNIVEGGQVIVPGPSTTRKGLVMEHLGGGTYVDARKDLKLMKKDLTPEQYHGTKQFLVKGQFEGLDHMHGKGLLHRDMKPDNIVLPGPADSKQIHPKIVDMGLCTPIKGQQGIVTESPFRAPELSKQATEKSDVYGAGATALYLTKKKNPTPDSPPTLNPPNPTKNNPTILQTKQDRNKFIQTTMDQDPAARPTVKQALQDPYLSKPLISDTEAQKVLQQMMNRRSK
jgi:serine/threonine protein kinase